MNIIEFLESNDSVVYLIIFMALWCAISFLIMLANFLKFSKKHKTTFKDKIYKEVPDNSSYDEIEYLLKRSLSLNSYLAYIYNYLYTKKITSEVFLNPKINKEDIRLTKTTTDDKDLNYFFSAFTFDNTINLSDITSCNYKVIDNMLKKYYNEKMDMINKLGIDEKINNDFALVYAHICIGLIAIIFLAIHSMKYLYFLIPVAILLIYLASIGRRNATYEELYKKYKAFNKYLTSYYKYDDNIDFNKLMPYAITFGNGESFYNTVIKHKNNKVNMDNNLSKDDEYNFFTNNYKILTRFKILFNKKN